MSAGLDRDDICADSSHAQRCGDPCLDVAGVHGSVEQQDVDELTRPLGVAIDAAGGTPEGLVGAGERPGLPCSGQRGGTGQCAGLGFENLEVVVQLDRLPGPGRHTLMPRDHGPAIEQDDLGRP